MHEQGQAEYSREFVHELYGLWLYEQKLFQWIMLHNGERGKRTGMEKFSLRESLLETMMFVGFTNSLAHIWPIKVNCFQLSRTTNRRERLAEILRKPPRWTGSPFKSSGNLRFGIVLSVETIPRQNVDIQEGWILRRR